MRALGDLLVHLPNREWFENELRALEAKEAGGPRRSEGVERLGHTRPQAASLGETRPRAENGQGRPSSGETVGEVLAHVSHVPVKGAHVLEAEDFVVDFTDDGDPIYAHVFGEVPWTAARLQRFVRQLQAKAQSIRETANGGL